MKDGSGVPRAGYTLPVFACAAAIAALKHLLERADADGGPKVKTQIATQTATQTVTQTAIQTVTVDLINPDQSVDIPIEQVARLGEHAALAITRSDPGDNLDLTRHTPVWAWVRWGQSGQQPLIRIEGGEGIGRTPSRAAIYQYAQQLLQVNLTRCLTDRRPIEVSIILPDGRMLARRTSNAAFGVVDGLSLLGTTGIAQPLSAPGQLASVRATLQDRVRQYPHLNQGLVYCIGENGLDLLRQRGIPDERVIKTANWIGPLLVEGAIQGVESILLFGYHGKLIKLAGGIFHTHHHLADGRLDILTAQCAVAGLPTVHLQRLFQCATTEAALAYLRSLDQDADQDAELEMAPPDRQNWTRQNWPRPNWTMTVYEALARRIDQRTQAYIYAHTQRHVTIGTILFGRDRQIICHSPVGQTLIAQLHATG